MNTQTERAAGAGHPKRKVDWWIYAIPALVALTIFFHLLLYFRPGRLGLAVYYLGPLLITFLAILFLVIALLRSLLRRPFFSRWRIAGFLGLMLFPAGYILRGDQQGNFFNAYPSGQSHKISKVAFRLPLDGPVTVAWGGDDAKTNYHVTYPDQRWAYDLVISKGAKTHAGKSTDLNSYYCYGQPVLAPAGGEVVEASGLLPDRRIGDLSETEHAGGNQIVIKVAKDEYLYICHLMPASLLVKKGDIVVQGQPLARAGNSGHTSEPHVHIDLEDRADNGGEGLPLYFSSYSVGGKIVARGMPTGGFDADGALTGQIVQHVPKQR